jgi:hypothetical protein
MYLPAWLLVVVALTSTIIARICVIIVFRKDSVSRRRDHKGTCHLAVFLGSGKPFTPPPAPALRLYPGGHSSEALTLVSTLDFSRYTPRTYLVSEGDSLSATKATALERLKAASEPSLVSVASFRSCLTIDRLGLMAFKGPYWRISDPHYPPCSARASELTHSPVHRAAFPRRLVLLCHPGPATTRRVI